MRKKKLYSLVNATINIVDLDDALDSLLLEGARNLIVE